MFLRKIFFKIFDFFKILLSPPPQIPAQPTPICLSQGPLTAATGAKNNYFFIKTVKNDARHHKKWFYEKNFFSNFFIFFKIFAKSPPHPSPAQAPKISLSQGPFTPTNWGEKFNFFKKNSQKRCQTP